MNQQYSHQSIKTKQDLLENFRAALSRHESPVIENYLSQVIAGERESLLRELLLLELSECTENQQTILSSHYFKRFPDYENCIHSVLNQTDIKLNPDTDQLQEDATTLLPKHETRESSPKRNSEQLEDFKLLNILGRGGMGVVYKAHQISLNRVVALKLIRAGELADQHEIDRFKIEARAAALLQHSGIVSIFETGELAGQHYIAMAYVEGQSLAERIKDKPFSAREAAALALPISEAVAYAHQQGVIHRDLKPANVLIDMQDHPQLTDFGLAKHMENESGLTASGEILGTPSYMPPEQAAGQIHLVTTSADIYSLGALLYAMLCGRPPFHADQSYITLMQVITQEPVSPRQLNPTIPIDLETICLKCLEKEPERRYASADELAAELQRFLSGEPILARPVSTLARFWRWCKRKPLIAGLSAAVILSLIIGLSTSIHYRIIAEKRAARAEEGTRIALTTLESVINTIQEKLRTIPEARSIRKELLRNSMADLKKLSGEVNSQARVDLNSANVLVDLGVLFQEVGDDSGMNATPAAESNYKNAVKIFNQLTNNKLISTDPDKQLMRDHARALERLGNLYIDSNRPSLATEPLKQALDIRRNIVHLFPNDLDQQGQLTWSIIYWGDKFSAERDFREAANIYPEAESVVRTISSAQPESTQYAHLYSVVQEKLGDTYHDLGENNKALIYFQKRFKTQQALCEKHPENIELQYELSYAYERLGNHWLQVGDATQALKMYEPMLELTQRALANDPQNLELQDGLLVCYEKLQSVYSLTKQTEKATAAAQEVNKLRAKLSRVQ